MFIFHMPVPVSLFGLAAAALLPLVAASIYPTQPVQSTVWSIGQPMRVSWVEDWKYPMLSEMGPIDMSLWRDTGTFLVPLASGVDPMAKTCQVTVPAWVLRQGSKYTLRFTTNKPINTVIYSADFTITRANATTDIGAAVGTGSDTVAPATQSGTGSVSGSTFRTLLTSTGSSSALTTPVRTNANANANANATARSSVRSSSTSSGTPLPSGATSGGGQGQGQGQGQGAANAGRRGASIDVEKLKFRFVFVIWPVLMGITMAW